MKFLIGCQYVGAVIGAIAGMLIGMTATTIFLQMLGAVVFGLSAVGIAVLSHAIYAGELAEQQTALLREIRDRLAAPPPADTQAPLLREIRDRLAPLSASAAPATQAPAPTAPAPVKSAGGAPWGQKTCPACRAFNDEYARTCTRCGVAFPPRG